MSWTATKGPSLRGREDARNQNLSRRTLCQEPYQPGTDRRQDTQATSVCAGPNLFEQSSVKLRITLRLV